MGNFNKLFKVWDLNGFTPLVLNFLNQKVTQRLSSCYFWNPLISEFNNSNFIGEDLDRAAFHRIKSLSQETGTISLAEKLQQISSEDIEKKIKIRYNFGAFGVSNSSFQIIGLNKNISILKNYQDSTLPTEYLSSLIQLQYILEKRDLSQLFSFFKENRKLETRCEFTRDEKIQISFTFLIFEDLPNSKNERLKKHLLECNSEDT